MMVVLCAAAPPASASVAAGPLFYETADKLFVEVIYPDGKLVTITKGGYEELMKSASDFAGKEGMPWNSTVPDVVEPEGWAKTAASGVMKSAEEGALDSKAFGPSWTSDVMAWFDAEGVMPGAPLLVNGLGTVIVGAGAFYAGWKIGGVIDQLVGISGGTTEEKILGCGCGSLELIAEGVTPYFWKNGSTTSLGKGLENPGSQRIVIPPETVYVYAHSESEAPVKNLSWLVSDVSTKPGDEKCETNLEKAKNPEKFEPPNAATLVFGSAETLTCGDGTSIKLQEAAAFMSEAQFLTRMGKAGFPELSKAKWPEGTQEREIAAPTKLTIAPTVKEIARNGEGKTEVPTVPTTVLEPLLKYVPEKDIVGPGKFEPALEPELPPIKVNELATTYKSLLETDGWTTVTIATLSESATDTSTGPSDAAYTVPSGAVALTTVVLIEANPATAAAPAEATKGSGGPSIPKIKFPEVPTPCTVFPFGVPCYIGKAFEDFAAEEKTPKFAIPLDKHYLNVNFAVADTLMEIVRAIELVLSTIGIILLFGRIASSSAGSGD